MSQIAVQSRASRFPERRAQRRMDALERGAFSFGQSLEERVKTLDSRLGVGVGATKERLKLAAKIAQRDAVANAQASKENAAEEKQKRKKEKAS